MKKNILGAMFDVRPIDQSGFLDIAKATKPQKRLNLKADSKIKSATNKGLGDFFNFNPTLASAPKLHRTSEPKSNRITRKNSRSSLAVLPQPTKLEPPLQHNEIKVTAKDQALQELEQLISQPLNVTAEVVQFGGRLHLSSPVLPQQPQTVDNFAQWWTANHERRQSSAETASPVFETLPTEEGATLTSHRRPWPASGGDRDKFTSRMLNRNRQKLQRPVLPGRLRNLVIPKLSSRKLLITGLTVLAVFIGFKIILQGGTDVKTNVVQNGKNAVTNLMEARESLLNFDFATAANSFALAHDDFTKASGRLNRVGASFISLVSWLPGFGKLVAANNLVTAGANISQAGGDLSSSLDELTKLKLNSFLTPQPGQSRQSIYELLKTLDDVLATSRGRINHAGGLLASVNANILPDDKQELFQLFKDKLPELLDFFGKSENYLQTLMALIGDKGTKHYLVLLQNNSELRATGGFPGSYALVTFQDGYLKEIKIDDSYNPDGQLKNNLIPPRPLQHITPTWGMRDANWFADFPTSAQKVADAYSKSTGQVVDGVVSLTPDVITDILAIIGPIEMPEYQMTLGAKNFLPQIQEQVEYGNDKTDGRPKQILADFEPKFLAKLSAQSKEQLLQISQALTAAFQQKRILGFFLNSEAEKLVLAHGLGGEIKTPPGDYLQVNISNIKGFKSDAVTENNLWLDSTLSGDGAVTHTLELRRSHTGGNSPQKFYNQPNPAYVRVYLPLGAQLLSIRGNDQVSYKPLADYNQSVFKPDSDLAAIESIMSHPAVGVDQFEESGKMVFGFWLIVDPGHSKKVILKYKIPNTYQDNAYSLYVQKQSGTSNVSFNATFELPQGKKVIGYLPAALQETSTGLLLTTDLNLDQAINIETK